MASSSFLGKLLFDKKPDLPGLQRIDLQEQQRKSVVGNKALLPELTGLARDVNAFNRAETLKARRESLPGYEDMLGKSSDVIRSQLAGELPEGVSDLVQNQAAARALGGGYGGSSMARALQARDLGLTSYDVTQKGLAAADRWLTTGSRFLTEPTFDVTSAFVTPMQQTSFAVNERNTRWNYQWFKNQLDAQPEPWQQALDQMFTNSETLGGLLSSGSTGSFGGMMGGAASGGAAAGGGGALSSL